MGPYHRIEDIPSHKVPVGELKVLSGKQGMVFFGTLAAGTEVPRHSHPNEQITIVHSGRMRYRIGDGEVTEVGPGEALVIPADVEHESWYDEECTITEFFSPPRLDMFPAAARHPYGIEE